jgi:glycerol-3-phosphate dehydrogenase (NAD(P)+)
VSLSGRDTALIASMRSSRVNPSYLSDCRLPDLVEPTALMTEAIADARYVVLAAPSHGLRGVLHAAAPGIEPGAILVSATKGLEVDSLLRMSEVAEEETRGRHPIVVLSGPSFAVEVARGLPTALVVASTDSDATAAVQEEFRSQSFRMYASDDVVGVEIGGALKNIIAIAAGVIESLELGFNARAGLVTRGLAEISRLACAMGARRDTLAGLSGLGDLVLTSTGPLSRNRHVGLELGRGRSTGQIVGGMRMVAEGINTTSAALALASRYDVELPIACEMAAVLAGERLPREAVARLMLRPQRDELEAASL